MYHYHVCLQLCSASQLWGIDVRDSLFDTVTPPVTLSRLNALEHEGRNLAVIDGRVLKELRHVLSERRLVMQATKALVKSFDTYLQTHPTTNTTGVQPPWLAKDGPVVEREDEDEATGGSSRGQVDSPKSTLADLQRWLHRAEALPPAAILHTYTPSLRYIVQIAEDLSKDVTDVLDRVEICSVRTQRYAYTTYILYVFYDLYIYLLLCFCV